MDAFFTELGRKVRARWQAENFSLARFPEIAVTALEDRRPAEYVDFAGLVHEFLLEDEQPFQTQSGFGQPELVVFDDPRFYIQLLFWLEGTTDIHQHKFSGAFHVLEGSSIHSDFVFENAQPITAHLRTGDLRMTQTRLLAKGSTVPIVSGGGHIHALFHLETPSVTVVVRTHSDPGTGPQFTYLPPNFAVDPTHDDALTTRRKQLLDVLEQTDDPRYADFVFEMVKTLDFERGFFILQNGMGCLRSAGKWDDVLDAFEQKHGTLARGVAATLEEIVRRDALAQMRAAITEPEHRFFLALLLNVPRREDILAMVAQRFSGDARETVIRWTEELAITSGFETWILDAEFPAKMDVACEDHSAVFAAALSQFLGKKTEHEFRASELDRLREAFRKSSFRALVS